MTTYPIIVGTDGTACSKAAVRWAAREARRRGAPLRVTHVYEWQWREPVYEASDDLPDLIRGRAEGIAANGVHQAHEAAAGLEVDGDAMIGHAAARLVEVSGDAQLMVLGSRGHGGFGSLLLGSVSQRVATHATCPVVIVRGRRDIQDGPIVVGVDGSPAADPVLEAAFEAASGGGCPLRVVRAYRPAIPPWLAYELPADADLPDVETATRRRLTEQLAPWRAKYPEVTVEVVLTPEGPAAALVEASRRARLVLVGSRGRGVIAGTLLGSVVLQLLHHADCPVWLVRPAAQRQR